jgi:pseudaminic acid biosynthesis-associated methylase
MTSRQPDDIAARSREAARLEQLWSGEFGDAYTERNADVAGPREPFWSDIVHRTQPERILEIGANVGANLVWLTRLAPEARATGLDVNAGAVAEMRRRLPQVGGLVGTARELPFATGAFDLVATVAVLIHQPHDTLRDAMAETVRCTRRWLLCAELYDPATAEVQWRDQSGALFKRDYGRIYHEEFPELRLEHEGFLGHDQGWDDVTFWLFAKS